MSKLKILESMIRRIVKEERNTLREDVSKLKSLVDDIKGREENQITNLQNRLSTYLSWIDEKTKVYEKNYSNLDKILRSNGFEITSLEYVTHTGLDTGISKFSLEDKPELRIEARLKMIGRRKPFKDQGYTARGSERQQGHHKLANQLVDDLKSGCPGMGFSVNQYSLMKSDNILFTMWIK